MIGRADRRAAALCAGLGLIACGLGTSGCTRPRSPEAACELLVRGISEVDASTIYDALLPSTQWSLDTVQKNHRAMRALINKSYAVEQRPAALARLYGAEADSGRELFQLLYPARYQTDFERRNGSGPPQVKPGAEAAEAAPSGVVERATCQRQQPPAGAMPFRLGKMQSGRWGLLELEREWDDAKLRAVHDLETVKKNAELFQQAR
jgi:hypothetical protein